MVSFVCRFTFLQIICAVAGVKESYHNLQDLFSMLDLKNHRECKLVVHLKAANIAVGIKTASAR